MFFCTGWGCSTGSTADCRRSCSFTAEHFTIIWTSLVLLACAVITQVTWLTLSKKALHLFEWTDQDSGILFRRCPKVLCLPDDAAIAAVALAEGRLTKSSTLKTCWIGGCGSNDSNSTQIHPGLLLAWDRDRAEPANLVNPGSDTVIVDASTAHRVADGTQGVAKNFFNVLLWGGLLPWSMRNLLESVWLCRVHSFSITSDTTDTFWHILTIRTFRNLGPWHSRTLQHSQSLT